MKFAKTLALAVVASALAASVNALSVAIPDTSENVVSTPFATNLRLDKIDMKDIEGSYLVHSANSICHGTPSITLRFSNRAAQERSFLVSAGVNYSASVNRSFSMQPGGTVEFTLFMPLAGEKGEAPYRSISIMETTPNASTGRVMKNLDVSMGQFDRNEHPQLLLSAGISPKKLQDDLSKAMHAKRYTQKHKRPDYSSHSGGTKGKYKAEPFLFNANQFKFPAENWPGDWRCYSTYDGVFITADEYATLGAAAKSALDAYRTLGGTVVVAKGSDGFADQKEAADIPQMIDQSCDVLVGDLNIRAYYYGGKSDTTEDLRRVPIAAKATIPVKTLLAVLAVFALGIVPLAVFISVRRNVRMKLLAFLPGSAAVFAVIVAISAYVFFGTTPSVRLQSVTVLDQTAKKALTLGQFAIFSPMSVNGRIEFPSDAAFARRNARFNGKNDDIRVESAAAQRLAGGWVKPLVTTFFDFTRVCERSERLDFRVSPTGGVAVVNLLGARVKTGHVNVGGRLWAFHDVEPGATVDAEKLEKLPQPPSGPRYPFADKGTTFGRDWKKNLMFVADSCHRLPQGEYVAEVEGSPFFENPLKGKKADTSAAGIVFGKFKEVAE